MNPIKAHLLDRLRPKDRTMTAMTDEEAFALGVRAVKAGFKPVRGCKDPAGNMLLSRTRTTGLSMDAWDVRVGQSLAFAWRAA